MAQLVYGRENISYECCNYNDINEKVTEYINNKEWMKYERCFITDISINDYVAELIESETIDYDTLNGHFDLLDHHPTAVELNKRSWCNVRINNIRGFKTCGTEMFYEYLLECETLPETFILRKFVSIIRDYDTWRWVELGEDGLILKQINDLYYIYGKDEFITWCISKIYDESFPQLYEKDKLVLNLRQREIDEYIEKKNNEIMRYQIQGYNSGVIFAERFISELGNKLCLLNPDIDFIAIISDMKTVSYRSVRDNIDLGKIAKLYGGGGHSKASGSQIDTKVKDEVLKLVFGK